MKTKFKNQSGITLIALIITIIILVILAAVSIRAITEQSIIGHAVNGSQDYSRKAKEEENVFSQTDELLEKEIKALDEKYDIYVAFYASDGTLRFASNKNKLPKVNTANGDKDYGNIRGKIYTAASGDADTPWFNEKESITSIDIIDTIKPMNMYGWFYYLKGIEEIDVKNIDTSECTDMAKCFAECSSLTKIDNISTLNTKKVQSMASVFYNCTNLLSLDLSGWSTEKTSSLNYMFYNCSNLSSLVFGSNFKTDIVTNMQGTFRNCSGLTTLNLSNWKTQNVGKMNLMFFGCSNLSSLTLSNNFKTDNVTTMYGMFTGCSSLESLDASGWNTGIVEDMKAMFKNCTVLSVDCSSWNVSSVSEHTNFKQNGSGNIIEPIWSE